MKKHLWAVMAAVLLVPFTACQLPQGGVGTLKITLPTAASISKAVTANSGKGNLARIQVLRNGAVVPVSGANYLETTFSGQTLTLDGFSPGSGYSLVVASGQLTTSNFYEVAYYQTSDNFEISAGVETAVAVTVQQTPVVLLTSGIGPFKTVSLSDHSLVYSARGSSGLDFNSITEYPASGTTLLGSTQSTGWNGRTLNSLGIGYDNTDFTSNNGNGKEVVFFNTTTGLGTLKNYIFTFNMVNTDSVTLTPDIASSGSFFTSTDAVAATATKAAVSANKYVIDIYAGAGLVAGMRMVDQNGSVAKTKWMDLDSNLSSLSQAVRDQLANVNTFISDFSVTGRFAYISTAVGVFRVPKDMIAGSSDLNALADKFTNGDADIKVTAKYNGQNMAISSIAGYTDGTAGLAIAGTSLGLFSSKTDANGMPIDSSGVQQSLSLVSGTYGLAIGTVRTYGSAFNSNIYTAAYSPTNGSVLLLTNGSVTKAYPRLSGLPQGDLSLTWWNSGTGTSHTLYLVVSGSDGTVLIPVAQS